METFEKRSFLFKVKEGEDLALWLHFVQPQEYSEYFEDSAFGFTSCKTGARHRDWAKRGVSQRSRMLNQVKMSRGIGPQDVRLQDRQETTLIFLHIPKAGGTTLHRIIERQYSKEATFTIDGNRVMESVETFKNLPEKERAHLRCLKGHMWFGLHRYLPQQAAYVTMLRDPVNRIISHYHFVMEPPGHYLHQKVVSGKMDMEKYVTSGISQELDDWQVKAVSGIKSVVLGYEPASRDTLEAAKRNLTVHFPAVGLLERFDESLLLLRRVPGWKNIFYVQSNVTHRRPPREDISIGALKAIERHNQLDMQLYEFAEEVLEQRLHELNLGKRELLVFRVFNRLYASTHRLAKAAPLKVARNRLK